MTFSTSNNLDRTTPPPISDIPALTLPSLQTTTLSNGMKLHIYNRCDSAVNQLTVVTPRGYAESSNPSTAALLAIMKSEGSRNNAPGTISSTLDFCGSWLSVSPTPHHLMHTMLSINKCMDRVLPVFADMVFHPTIPDEILSTRREMLARNIEMSLADVSYLARCRCDELIMGPDHALAMTDTPQLIRSISSDDLLRFQQSTICSNQTDIFLAGDITESIERMVIKQFEQATPDVGNASFNIAPFSPQPPQRAAKIELPGAKQCCVAMAQPAIPRSHPDYHNLHITVGALGGYFGSRLMLNIREEKGLTYGISAQLLGYIDDACILISAETAHANVETLIEEVKSELRRLADNPPCGEELRRLCQSLISSQSATLDTPFDTIRHYTTALTSGLPDGYFNSRTNHIASITPEIIADTARRYLNPDNLRIAVAG